MKASRIVSALHCLSELTTLRASRKEWGQIEPTKPFAHPHNHIIEELNLLMCGALSMDEEADIVGIILRALDKRIAQREKELAEMGIELDSVPLR